MTETSFTRCKRLLTPAEFKRVFEHTEWRSSTHQFLLLASSNEQQHARLGFVFAKKNIKHAVQRNRLKRIVRESFRAQHEKLPALDFVLLGRKGAAELDNAEVRAMIDALWFRLKRPSNERKTNGRSKTGQHNRG